MFIDASVMVAMMTDEAEARAFAVRMQASTVRLTSPIEVARAASEVSVILNVRPAVTAEAIGRFLQLMNIQVLAVPPRAAFIALEAQSQFGSGAHAANLSADESMTYACARYYRQPLLSRSGGFALTDIDIA